MGKQEEIENQKQKARNQKTKESDKQKPYY